MELMSQETNHQPVADRVTVSPEPAIQEHLQTLESLVARFERLIEGRSRESLQQPGEDGRWGVVEVLCHLRDWEVVLRERIDRILEEDRPEFEEVDALMWPLEHDYREQDSIEVFGDLTTHRQALVRHLQDIAPAAWDRTAVLDDGQVITLREIVGMAIAHDEQYLQEAREAIA
jgi:hypothetical protein